jgi:hypothetical protein
MKLKRIVANTVVTLLLLGMVGLYGYACFKNPLQMLGFWATVVLLLWSVHTVFFERE